MAQPRPEHKPAPYRLVRFVEVPRALVPVYGDKTWAEVVAAAQQGTDGLAVVDADFYGTLHARPDTAWLREYRETGGCLVFRQNWIDSTNDEQWRRVP